MSKVVDLAARREKWNTSWSLGDLVLSVSNHGRICVQIGDEKRLVDLVDSVALLSQVSTSFEELSGL
jgi:hypothetical protein